MKLLPLEKQFLSNLEKLSEPEVRQVLARTSKLFEIPCGIDTWLDSPYYMNLKGVVWPSVREDLNEIFNPEKNYDEAVLLEAIGSGKSFEISLILARLIYEHECWNDPTDRYPSIAKGSNLAFINMSTSGLQAKTIIFADFQKLIDNSPWFQTYCKRDERILSIYKFPKNIFVLPGNSSMRFPLGFNVLGAVIDEASFLESESNLAKGKNDKTEEIYNALKKRKTSRFLSGGFIGIISSPNREGDFVVTKFQEARTNPRIYAKRRTLWEAKPKEFFPSGKTFTFKYSVGEKERVLEVPIELEIEFKRNPHMALRDYASIPSLALNPYMDSERVRDIGKRSKLLNPVILEDSMGYPIRFRDDFKPEAGCSYYIHIDLAISRDNCGIAMGHWSSRQRKNIIDFCQEIQTSIHKHLDFARVRGIVEDLRIMGFFIDIVSYDNFQSTESKQILESQGYRVEELSVDRDTDAYDTLLGMINENKIDYYAYEPLMFELERLELVGGKKVDHPPKGKKDVADAVAGVAYWLGTEHSDGAIAGLSEQRSSGIVVAETF